MKLYGDILQNVLYWRIMLYWRNIYEFTRGIHEENAVITWRRV